MMQEQNIASISKRVSSFIIDDIVVGIFLAIILYDPITALGMQISSLDAKSAKELINQFLIDSLPIVISIKVIYHSILVWLNGMTFGKYILKIKVVDMQSGNKVSFAQALFRSVLRVVSEMPFYLGFALAFVTPKRQTFHDKLSNCVVVDV